MPLKLTNAQRQKRWRENQRNCNDRGFLKWDKTRKQAARAKVRADPVKYAEALEKDRKRKRKRSASSHDSVDAPPISQCRNDMHTSTNSTPKATTAIPSSEESTILISQPQPSTPIPQSPGPDGSQPVMQESHMTTPTSGKSKESPLGTYRSRQSLGKGINRVNAALPKSPSKKITILSQMVHGLSPASKAAVLGGRRAPIGPIRGRPIKISSDVKVFIIQFLERPDISYTCPGRKDQVYCGKGADGNKVYKTKHYLLWKLREIIPQLNEALCSSFDESTQVTYGTLWRVIQGLKQIKYLNDIPEETCACDICENLSLLLQGLRRGLVDRNQFEHILKSPGDLLKSVVCSPDTANCIDGICNNCSSETALSDLEAALQDTTDITFLKWVHGDKYPEKQQQVMTGSDAYSQLESQLHRYKRHHYNFCRQHVELKTLKDSLGPNEVIIQTDFSENYTNTQKNAIQSSYFGCESFALYTACAWYRPMVGSDVVCNSYVVVSDELDHSKFLVVAANKLLISLVRQHVPELHTVHFWSDGCTKQFKSKYCFYLLTEYPSDLKVIWNFFESHHGKGPVDGVGGHVKMSVYRDVKASKVIIRDANHFSEYADQTIKNIKVLYIGKEALTVLDVGGSKAVPGTLQVHSVERLVEPTETTLNFYRNSQYCDSQTDSDSQTVSDRPFQSVTYPSSTVCKKQTVATDLTDEAQQPQNDEPPLMTEVSDISTLSSACNIVVMYEGHWWLTKVDKLSVDNNDVFVSFLHPKGPTNTFFWPSTEDKCWIPLENIIGKLEQPVLPISSSKVGIAAKVVKCINDRFSLKL